MKFSKMRKTALKNLNEEKYKQSGNEKVEAFERVIMLLLYTFFEKEKKNCNK